MTAPSGAKTAATVTRLEFVLNHHDPEVPLDHVWIRVSAEARWGRK
jgi:hypothetical protein